MARPKKQLHPVEADNKAQAYAMRVWNGQSVSLFRKERVERVERALAGQGFTADEISAVVLPE